MKGFRKVLVDVEEFGNLERKRLESNVVVYSRNIYWKEFMRLFSFILFCEFG